MSSGARAGLVIAVIAVLAVIAAFVLGLIDISQTREGRLPAISVSGGQAPAFDVSTARIGVDTESKPVDVPKVEVGTTRRHVDVPVVAVKKPQ
jgi:hypothetical protein